MQFSYGMHLEQSQKLIMTPELRQAIQLLQYSSMELMEYIQNELEENPTLELNEERDGEVVEEEQEEKQQEIDWENYFQDNQSGDEERGFREVRDCSALQNWLCNENTLYEYLILQLNLSTGNRKDICIGTYLIGTIDDNGYLTATVEEISRELHMPVERVESTLQLIQSFEPAGVGARDLTECLLLQLRYLEKDEPLLEKIITDYLPEIADGKMAKVAEELDISLKELQEMVDVIATLDPKPGRRFGRKNDVRYLIPDVFVEKAGDDFVVILNDVVTPHLSISNYYQKVIKNRSADSDALKFIEDKLNSAVWLIRSIEQRRMTIYKVTESIVKFQRDFFEHGVRYMRPLILKDVANDVGIHESTVSRATTNKYVQTPHGLFELSFFFTSGLDNLSGTGVSSEAVKKMIEDLVKQENAKKPYSDQKIAEILKEKGIEISRRTVAKYRDELHIPSSSKRKRY